jgi:hypothetical protein
MSKSKSDSVDILGPSASSSRDAEMNVNYSCNAKGNTTKRLRKTNAIDDVGERISLNVGGIMHETRISTLLTIPHTRLSRLAETHCWSLTPDRKPEMYYFDRNPVVFVCVLDFYRSGKFCVCLQDMYSASYMYDGLRIPAGIVWALRQRVLSVTA